MKKASWFLFTILFAFSCLDEPECYLLNNNLVGIYFRVMGSGGLDSVALRKVLVNGKVLQTQRSGFIDVFDKDHDTLVSSIQLPVDYFNEETLFEFGDKDAIRELALGYRVRVQYVSEECGPRYILSDLNEVSTSFDSLRYVDRTPARDASSRHIEVFRCPVTDTLTVVLNQLTFTAPTTTTPFRESSRVAAANLSDITVNNATSIFSGTRKATVRLPVDLSTTSTTYDFNFADDFGYAETNRELVVNYETTSEQRYRYCGAQTFVTDLELLSTSFDSVSFAKDNNNLDRTSLTDPFNTNLNLYRCPPTNIIQLAFRTTAGGTSSVRSVPLVSITSDYNPSQLYYQNVPASLVQLPLNLEANSTTFTLNFEGRTETLTVSYTRGAPPSTLFRSACSDITLLTNLTVSGGNATASVESPYIVYPATTNVFIEVPQ